MARGRSTAKAMATTTFAIGPANATSAIDRAAASQRGRVDHDRLRPAEAGDHQHERADRIDVRDRVERQAAHGSGPMVTQLIGREARG